MFLGRLREIAPVVLTVHDTNAFNGDPTAALQRLGFHAALRACDRLIVHTRQGEARLRAIGIPAARISVIPHGTTPAVPVQAEHPDQPVTFVLFGKLKPYKGADLLVEAFARLTERQRGRARVRIIGQSYMKLGGLQDRIAALDLADRITIEDRFVGDDEVAAVFAEGTIAVFPYREIEASGVLYLAIEHARPVIASAIGTFAESLTDGVHGSLVPSGDVAALSTAMARMIEDAPFRHAASASIARLSQESPDWLQVGRLTQAAYAAVLGTTSSVERVPAAQLAQGI
jgi:glycosyltransferase involved in cell wall biosynthesis